MRAYHYKRNFNYREVTTTSISLPSAQDIRELVEASVYPLEVGKQITIDIGQTKKHPKDNHNKKIAREMSDKASKLEIFKVGEIDFYYPEFDVILYSDSYKLVLKVKGEKVFLSDVRRR